MAMSPQLLTQEEIEMVKSFLVLPLVLSVFERDKATMDGIDAIKTKGPYLDAINRAMDRCTSDLTEVRRQMRQRGIKVYEQERYDGGLRAKYLCRGYHHEMGLLWNTTRSDVEILMRTYLGVN